MKSFLLLVVFLAAEVLPEDRVFDWNKGCGLRPMVAPPGGSRFLGGQYAMEGAYPWQVSVQRMESPIAGGTIVSPHFVLASPNFGSTVLANKEEYRLVAGMISLSQPGPHAQFRSIEKARAHPGYSFELGSENEIMVLQVDRPWDFNAHVQPICIPSQESEEVSLNFTHCTYSGWLRVYNKVVNTFLDRLKYIEVELLSKYGCGLYAFNMDFTVNTDDRMCILQRLPSLNDSGQSDVGGPLQCYSVPQQRFYQLGVSCYYPGWFGKSDMPGLYTRVSRYSVWINDTITSMEYEMQKSPSGGVRASLVLVLLSGALMLLTV